MYLNGGSSRSIIFLRKAVHNIFRWGYKTISSLMINEQIRDKEVRVIGEEGQQLGIMSSRDAMKLAKDAGLDLVKIAPTAKPPVCKISQHQILLQIANGCLVVDVDRLDSHCFCPVAHLLCCEVVGECCMMSTAC